MKWTEGSSVVSKSFSYTFTAQASRTLIANFKYEVDVSRIYGSNRYTTAIQVSQAGWPSGADTVLLARADDFADALAGVPLAYHLDAPILLTATNQLHAATKEEIEGLEAERVILLGGIAAISDNVKLELEAMGLTVERIAGAGRYDTASLGKPWDSRMAVTLPSVKEFRLS